MYYDLLKVDLFLCQMRSNKRLVSFAAITVLWTHPGMYLALSVFFQFFFCEELHKPVSQKLTGLY